MRLYSHAGRPRCGSLGLYRYGRERRAIYRRASGLGSLSPLWRISELLGIQYHAAAFAVVPPIWGAFSSMMMLLPNRAAFRAAEKPAAPLPTTTISASLCQATSSADTREVLD